MYSLDVEAASTMIGPLYKARAALYDDEGNYIKDSLLDRDGTTRFHNLTDGDYEVKLVIHLTELVPWVQINMPIYQIPKT